MASLKYNVNISYMGPHINGQQLVNISGVTQSVPSYSSEYYVASMPELSISATGSSYGDALTNLLVISSTAPDSSTGPLSSVRTW